jgi:TRAP-type C4-dicarboxylate transport system substrate-binding protein
MTLSCPFLIRNNTELDIVLNDQKSELERQINSKGHFTLAWSKVGWIKFFSKGPVFVPADLKQQKLGTNKDQPALTAAFKSMGYQMVPISVNEILMNLNSGMIDAVYQSPVTVAGLQIFGRAKNMASINVAPFMGAIVMNGDAWRSIPDKYKPELVRITRTLETDLDSAIQEFEASIIMDVMRPYGLVINQLTPEQEQLWYDDMTKIVPGLVGKSFSQTIYNRISSVLKTYRDSKN